MKSIKIFGIIIFTQNPRTFTAQKKYRITSILSKAPTRFELVIEVLQTFALPLGYGAIYYIILTYLLNMQIFLVTPTGIEPVLPP